MCAISGIKVEQNFLLHDYYSLVILSIITVRQIFVTILGLQLFNWDYIVLQHLAAVCHYSTWTTRRKNIVSSLMNIPTYVSINLKTIHAAEHKFHFHYVRNHTKWMLKVCIVFG